MELKESPPCPGSAFPFFPSLLEVTGATSAELPAAALGDAFGPPGCSIWPTGASFGKSEGSADLLVFGLASVLAAEPFVARDSSGLLRALDSAPCNQHLL